MATLDDSTFQAVNNANFKAMAELGTQNALSHQNRVNVIAEKALMTGIDQLGTTSVPEGLGLAAAQRGDLTKVLAELGSIAASLQQVTKAAQTTPPQTG